MSRDSRSPRASDRMVRADAAPPRALFLINDLRMGGAERSFMIRVNHLQHVHPRVVLIDPAVGNLLGELSTQVELFSLHESDPKPMSRTDLGEVATVASRQRRGRPRGQMLFESPRLLQRAYRLARLARATDVQVVSTFLNRSHAIALLAQLLFAPRLRVVINVQEMLSDSLVLHFAPAERRLMRAFITRAFPRAQRIIAVSDGVKQDLVRHFAIAEDRIAVIPSPIDLKRIRSASEEPVDDVPVRRASMSIVGVGRLVRLKGFDVLIRAFAQLPATLRATLLIIGEGEERPALERLMVELKVADRVSLIGTRANPWKYMARADVIALPSRTEAFPNVIGEALALAVPVVAARCSEGVADYLEGGRCGVLVPPDDVAALAEALQRVLTDEALRHHLTQRGAVRAEAFDRSEVVPRYERLIAEAARE